MINMINVLASLFGIVAGLLVVANVAVLVATLLRRRDVAVRLLLPLSRVLGMLRLGDESPSDRPIGPAQSR